MTETRAGDRQQQTTAEISEPERCRLLADERRRTALTVLAERSSAVTLTALATALGARESGRIDEQDSHQMLEIRLHHVHLPLMDDVGVVDYDHEEHRVEPRQSRLEQLL